MKTMIVALEIPEQHVETFTAALTGNDRDVILAAERAINARLELDSGTVRIDTSPRLPR